MSGFDAAKYYNAIKLHFNSESYDAIKYNYKVRLKFVPENQLYWFQKLYTNHKEDLINFYVSNFLENKKISVFELCTDNAESVYNKWKMRNDSLAYTFKTEMGDLLNEYSLNELLLVKKTHPILMTKVMQEKVSLETLLIADSVLQFINRWKRDIKEEIVWNHFLFLCEKYRPFMSIDLPKMKAILKQEVVIDVAK